MKSWLIGSASKCDLIIDQNAVSGAHCRLAEQDDGYLLEDLQSTNGTYVNGKRISSPQRVSPADKITLGKKIKFPWPDEVSSISGKVITVGQSADNDVVIDRPTISGHHIRLTIEGDELLLTDLESTNGTFLGSKRIHESIVEVNDKVLLGSHEITVREIMAAGKISSTHRIMNPQQPSVETLGRKAAKAATHATPAPQAAAKSSAKKSDQRLAAAELRAEPKQKAWMFPTIIAALLIVSGGGALMIWSRGGESETVKQRPSSAEPMQTTPPSPQARRSTTGFRMGNYDPDHVVHQIKVTIRVGAEHQDLNEPVDLDLGAGFVLRLSSAATDVPSSTAVAFPQKSSLKPTETTVAAGQDAWFEFSAKDEENSEGQFSATPQILADLSFRQIRQIRFVTDAKQSDWMLAGYEIQINGQPFASHDAVKWRAKQQSREDETELAKLLATQQELADDIAAAEAYIKQGLAEVSDERDLREKQKESVELDKTIKTLRASINDPRHSYVERNPSFRPGQATASSTSEN